MDAIVIGMFAMGVGVVGMLGYFWVSYFKNPV
jgi:hypothetical protein